MNVTDGIFLPLSDQETADLDRWLADNDYPTGPDGIRQLLLDTVAGEIDPGDDSAVERIAEYIQEHPELVTGARNAVAGLGRTLGGLVRRKH